MGEKQFGIIAVDFDGTLCKEAYPKIGEANAYLITLLKQMKANGSKLILWTCRSDKLLLEAIAWSKKQGIQFDAVNDNVPEIVAKYGNNSRKIYADVYIDDKACFPWLVEEKREVE